MDVGEASSRYTRRRRQFTSGCFPICLMKVENSLMSVTSEKSAISSAVNILKWATVNPILSIMQSSAVYGGMDLFGHTKLSGSVESQDMSPWIVYPWVRIASAILTVNTTSDIQVPHSGNPSKENSVTKVCCFIDQAWFDVPWQSSEDKIQMRRNYAVLALMSQLKGQHVAYVGALTGLCPVHRLHSEAIVDIQLPTSQLVILLFLIKDLFWLIK